MLVEHSTETTTLDGYGVLTLIHIQLELELELEILVGKNSLVLILLDNLLDHIHLQTEQLITLHLQQLQG